LKATEKGRKMIKSGGRQDGSEDGKLQRAIESIGKKKKKAREERVKPFLF